MDKHAIEIGSVIRWCNFLYKVKDISYKEIRIQCIGTCTRLGPPMNEGLDVSIKHPIFFEGSYYSCPKHAIMLGL